MMSIETAQEFLGLVGRDEPLRQRVVAVKAEPMDQALSGAVEIGADAGYSFTAPELQQAIGGVSDEQLEAAAGGHGDSLAQKTSGDDPRVAAICNGVTVLAWARVDGES